MLLHDLYGIESSTVYNTDGVANRLGAGLVGYQPHTLSYSAMRESSAAHLIKTHRPFDAMRDDGMIDGADKAICLFRDGRDATVSWARQRAEDPNTNFHTELSKLVDHPEAVGAGCWGSNALSWIQAPLAGRGVVQFHDLIVNPRETVSRLVSSLDLDLPVLPATTSRSFEELHAIDPAFFRVGRVGTHRNEMPPDLHERFLAIPRNRAALRQLGYL